MTRLGQSTHMITAHMKQGTRRVSTRRGGAAIEDLGQKYDKMEESREKKEATIRELRKLQSRSRMALSNESFQSRGGSEGVARRVAKKPTLADLRKHTTREEAIWRRAAAAECVDLGAEAASGEEYRRRGKQCWERRQGLAHTYGAGRGRGGSSIFI